MLEGGAIKNSKDVFSWWCGSNECKKHEDNCHREKRREKLHDNVEQFLIKHGINRKYYTCTLDNYVGYDDLVSRVKKYIKTIETSDFSENSSLLLTGNSGTGKTHIAVSIIRNLIKDGRDDVFFKNIPELMLDLRKSFNEDSKLTESDIINHYSSIGFLVLDDLGSEKTSEYAVTSLYMIINRRLSEMKSTIITTNLSLDEIESEISSRISSRLAEYQVMRFNMNDYRRKRK